MRECVFAGEKDNLSLRRGAGTAGRSVSRVPTFRNAGRTDGFAMDSYPEIITKYNSLCC
jgi:hypothetical protein